MEDLVLKASSVLLVNNLETANFMKSQNCTNYNRWTLHNVFCLWKVDHLVTISGLFCCRFCNVDVEFTKGLILKY